MALRATRSVGVLMPVPLQENGTNLDRRKGFFKEDRLWILLKSTTDDNRHSTISELVNGR